MGEVAFERSEVIEARKNFFLCVSEGDSLSDLEDQDRRQNHHNCKA